MNLYEIKLHSGFHHTIRVLAEDEQHAHILGMQWDASQKSPQYVMHEIGTHSHIVDNVTQIFPVTQVLPQRCSDCGQTQSDCLADSLDARNRRTTIENFMQTLSPAMAEHVEVLLNAYLRHQLNECNTESEN